MDRLARAFLSRIPVTFIVPVAVFFVALFSGGNPARTQSAPPGAEQNQERKNFNGIDKAHSAVSAAIVAPAAWLDSFFGDERVDVESNRTRVRLKSGALVEEGRGVGFTTKVGVKIVLPRTGKRLNLQIGGEADDETDLENTSKDSVREKATERDKENVGIGFQYFLYRSDRSNLSAAAGVRLSGSSPVGVFRGRYRYSLPLDGWLARYIQRVQWLTKDEFIVPTQLEFERPLTEDLLFKTSFGGTWFEREDGYFYGAGASVRERLSDDSAISYEWNNQFRTEPNNRLEEIALRVRYRRSVWRKWLKFELAPQLSFPRERDFDATPGVFVGFEISFGG